MKTKDIKNAFFMLLETTGWKKDRYGHYHKDLEFTNFKTKEINTRHVRVKVQTTAVRIEVKSEAAWFKKGGDYFSRMVILENGSIQVGSFTFKRD